MKAQNALLLTFGLILLPCFGCSFFGGARRPALDVYREASDVANEASDDIDRHSAELGDLLYPRDGFYVGVSGGLTVIDETGKSIEHRLENTYGDVDVDMSDVDFGAKVYVGYRFDLPVALELGFTSLGGRDSDVVFSPGDPGDETKKAQDVEDHHPITAHGVTLAVQAYIYETHRFALTTKVGAWYWWANTEVGVRTEPDQSLDTDRIGREDFDPLLGAGLQYRFTPSIFGRLEYERYFLDTNDVDLWSLGIFYKF